LGRSNGWISLITAQQDRSRPVTLLDLRDQSFSGTSAAFSFDSTVRVQVPQAPRLA
jgi:hypothetical protein